MTAAFFFLLGILIGGAVVWWLARRGQADLGVQLARGIETALPQVAEAVLAPKAQQLERAAGQELRLLGADTVNQVKTTQAGMQATMQTKLEAMQQQLASYQTRLHELDKERAGEQARLQQQIEAITSTGALMAQEARTLREALATSGGVRGNWGEEVLANLLTLCGLNQNLDFDLQVDVAGEARLRPDAVIHLPSGRNLAIDAKASITAFLDGLELTDAAARHAAFARFAQVLRARAKELAGKEYSRYLTDSLPCVVMFVPSEAAFRAALDADPELFLYGQKQQPAVVLASPSTLFPLISIIAQGWRQHEAGQQMQRLMKEVQEFGVRLQTFLKHIQGVGQGIDAAGKAYNAALASYRTRLEPKRNQLVELGAGWAAAEALKPVENRPLLAVAGTADAAAE